MRRTKKPPERKEWNVDYKNFKIKISKELSLGGWMCWYFSAVSPEGHVFVDSFEDSDEHYYTVLESMKTYVDNYIENPTDYE